MSKTVCPCLCHVEKGVSHGGWVCVCERAGQAPEKPEDVLSVNTDFIPTLHNDPHPETEEAKPCRYCGSFGEFHYWAGEGLCPGIALSPQSEPKPEGELIRGTRYLDWHLRFPELARIMEAMERDHASGKADVTSPYAMYPLIEYIEARRPIASQPQPKPTKGGEPFRIPRNGCHMHMVFLDDCQDCINRSVAYSGDKRCRCGHWDFEHTDKTGKCFACVGCVEVVYPADTAALPPQNDPKPADVSDAQTPLPIEGKELWRIIDATRTEAQLGVSKEHPEMTLTQEQAEAQLTKYGLDQRIAELERVIALAPSNPLDDLVLGHIQDRIAQLRKEGVGHE